MSSALVLLFEACSGGGVVYHSFYFFIIKQLYGIVCMVDGGPVVRGPI